ncbi:unnamed protein product [Prunus armeniaca]|uniref:NB-ARC domain-containing protein n=1 Tax=Prunus armeniaca TaxID=36596 RepID=A0A6J5U9F0_PRUAR|nr:unnamed protein product [Prunus armeniaca]
MADALIPVLLRQLAVLEDAEKRQVKEATSRDWLEKLKDVSYEMDDVLDEWNTEFLRQQVEKQEEEEEEEEEGKDALVAKMKIKDLNDRLNEIAIERQTYNFQTTEKGIEHRRESSSFVDISKTFGRENEKEFIVSKLSESSVKGCHPLVIPIVGMGGIGKTTLAQLVYNDESIKAHFEKRIWVCVSEPFDTFKIAKAIIDGNGTPNSDGLEAFLQCMSKSVEGKKFLLVLDDMWTQDHREWEQLKLPLQNGSTGSKILVTTRKEGVAIMMGAESDMIRLNELSEPYCWSLFHHIACFDRGEDESNVFEAIGKDVKKCKGLPLAAKTLGSLMRFKKTREEWEDVLHSKIWEPEEIERECFFQDFAEDDFGNVRFKMHDIVHDFAQFLTKKVAFVIEVKDANKRIELPGYKVRHLTLIALEDPYGSHTSLLAPVSSEICKSMRTLTTFGSRISTLDPDFILQLKALRTLNLSYNIIAELPKEIGELIHLRYVDLSRNYPLVELPNTMCSLYNLQNLCLDFCRQLATLPKAMEKLIKLKHLHVMCCDELKYLPKGIGRLTSLRALDGFHLCGGDDKNDTFKLGDLRLLDKLEGSLFISELGNLTDASEVKKAQLWNKKHILHLRLDFWNGDDAEGDRKSDVEILNVLEGPQKLKSLDICNYSSTLSPKSISLHSLRSLTLHGWRYCEVLPPLGKLPSLENLRINDMPSLKKVGVEFLGIEETQTPSHSPTILFPKLKQLSFDRVRDWEEWEGKKIHKETVMHTSRLRLIRNIFSRSKL